MKNENTKLEKGQKVFFVGEKLPMIINEINENFAICSRDLHKKHDADILKHRVEMNSFSSFKKAYEFHKDSLIYKVLDFKNNIMGPHDSYGYGLEKDTLENEAKEILQAVTSNKIQISFRYRCALNIDYSRKL